MIRTTSSSTGAKNGPSKPPREAEDLEHYGYPAADYDRYCDCLDDEDEDEDDDDLRREIEAERRAEAAEARAAEREFRNYDPFGGP